MLLVPVVAQWDGSRVSAWSSVLCCILGSFKIDFNVPVTVKRFGIPYLLPW